MTVVRPTLSGSVESPAFFDKFGKALEIGPNLLLARCPHCGIADPLLTSNHAFVTQGRGGKRQWVTFICQTCGGTLLVSVPDGGKTVTACYPALNEIDASVPARPKEYLKQAREGIAQPLGSIVVASGAIDAMLKDKGLKTGSLYARIDEAAVQHLITPEMAAWAHEVRLDANDQRHVDDTAPMPTQADAVKCVEFAMALAEYLYVLPARVTRGRKTP